MKFNLLVLKKRSVITVAALALAAGMVAGRERPTLELVQERAPQVADDGIDLSRLNRGEATTPQTDLFARRDFAPQKQQARNIVEKPVAPPLPFKYFGRLTENGKTDVFVMRGEDLLAVAAGETLGEYRVDAVSESSISFTYLPLKTKQTLGLQ
ncbi:MAG TPA: hypothetical protein VNC62_19450, partial [Burkholderiales bacterium]|jgi:hypothetical protein|nr:hypothetical protein [Burkholderiales bacterium]